MANGLTVGLDNWVYAADYVARFRFMGGKWNIGADKGRSQWGLAQDDYGRLYFNYNSDVLRCDVLPAQYFLRNPNWPGTTGTNVQIMRDQTTWPGHPTPGVNRGYDDVTLRDDGSLRTVTATCGVHVYRGGLIGREFDGNAYACEPAGNLVKRMLVSETAGTLKAQNAYYGTEFLTSTDERFRPVNIATGPDGAMYIVDMYRGIIEHERFLTNYLIKNIEQRKLVSPIHMGRIYRIVPTGSHPKEFVFPTDTPGLIQCLTSPNGFVRDTAQRLLVERHDFDNVDPLIHMAAAGPTALSRLHALWALDGMNQMQIPIALAALGDRDAHVRAAGIRLCEQYLIPATRPEVLPELLKLAADPDPAVQVQLVLTLSSTAEPKADEVITSLLDSNHDIQPATLRDAALSGLRGREVEFLEKLFSRPAWSQQSTTRADTIAALSRCVYMEHRAQGVERLIQLAADQSQELSWRRTAILRGTTEPLAGAIRRTPKMLYLPHKPDSLASMLDSSDRTVKSMASRLDKTLAWPDKPGVPPPPVVVPLTSAQQAQFEHGKQIYTNICAACHQLSGTGQEGLAPPLVDSEWLLGTPQRTARIVLNGVTGPIKVGGVDYQLEMPGLAAMSDQDIADVLTYARREWEHTADPVSPETVQHIREATKERGAAWTAPELTQIR
jgi:mono/diheme cytochrome c family protein